MSKCKCFSISSQNLVSIYVSILATSIITLLINNVIAGAVEATSIKEQSIDKYQSRELTAQNSESTTNIDYLDLKEEILAEINRVRTNPQAYADWLEDRKQYFEGTLLKLPGEKPIITNKGKEALEEAIAWLNNLEPLPKISSSAKLVNIAQEQIKLITSQQGNTNLQGQTISYGKYTPEGIVMQLIVDDGYPNRINRQKILNPNIQSAGIMCERHNRYENICAVAYDGDSLVTTAENPNIPASTEEENQATPELVVVTKEEGLVEKTTPNESDNNSIAPLPNVRQRNNTSLLVEKIQQGKLEEGDTVIPNDGSFYDSYPIEGIAGDSLVISVESQDFDTFLAIMDAKGNILEQNDDISETNSNSRLKITLPNNGVYKVIVNAYDQGGKGSYLLTVRR